jgi:hypothetical protein
VTSSGASSTANQAPSTDNFLVSIRKSITTLRASGYSPNLILLTPAASEEIDVMVSGLTGGSADFVFGRRSSHPARCSESRAPSRRC